MKQCEAKSTQWSKPKFRRLGAIKDVAGSKTINNDGPAPNAHS
jgi:hypothetical protein